MGDYFISLNSKGLPSTYPDMPGHMSNWMTSMQPKISLKLPGLAEPVAIELIVCLEANINYVWLHYRQDDRDQKHLAAKTLKWVEAQLPGFIRIHQSLIINPAHIAQTTSYNAQHMMIRMGNGMSLPVSRRRVERVRQLIDQLRGREEIN